MELFEVRERTPVLIEQLTAVWESSVRATHLFLPEEEILVIKAYVPQALAEVPRLVVLAGSGHVPAAFMGVAGERLEMLFVAAPKRGQGLGGRLLRYGVEACGVRELTVNEQNPQARSFYEHMGFRSFRRTDRDEQGRPYPLLYMRLNGSN